MRTDYRQLKPYREYQRTRMLATRLGVVRVLLILGFVIYVAVFWYLQIVNGPEYRQRAEENRLRRRVETPVRGNLRDMWGENLATNRPSFSVYLDRQRTEQPEREIRNVAQLLDEDESVLLSRYLAKTSSPKFLPVLLLEDVELEQAARIQSRSIELSAIDVVVEARRYYAAGTSMAHLIGYVAEATGQEVEQREELKRGDLVGRTGIERAFDNELRGTPGMILEEINARGRPLEQVSTVRPTQHGDSIVLTMDLQLQKDLELAIAGRRGAAVFLDPRSGAIRALHSSPTFDPNLFSARLTKETWSQLSEDEFKPLQNRAIAGAYPPASTFKIVTAAAAIAEGVLEKDETVYCGGSGVFYGRRFQCYRGTAHGYVNLETAIRRSCNVFFYTMGQRLGIDNIERWSKNFGLGKKTGLGLGAEVSGLIPSREWKQRARGEIWYPGETISVAIGQGPVLVTPLQMAVVASIVANGGNLVSPHMAQLPGRAPSPKPLELDPVMLNELANGMIGVVNAPRGTARRARVKGHTVAGKTGTAQVVALDAENDPGDHAWFIGFAPAENPVLAFAILLEHGGGGGREAAPIASTVLTKHFERHPVQTDPEPEVDERVADVASLETR